MLSLFFLNMLGDLFEDGHENIHEDRLEKKKQLIFIFGFPLIFGLFVCIFKHLQQKRIHLGGLNQEYPPKYTRECSPSLCSPC